MSSGNLAMASAQRASKSSTSMWVLVISGKSAYVSGCGTIGSGALAIPTVTSDVAAPWIAPLGSSSMMRCIAHN